MWTNLIENIIFFSDNADSISYVDEEYNEYDEEEYEVNNVGSMVQNILEFWF